MHEIVAYGWLTAQLILMVGGSFTTLIGIVTVIHWFKKPEHPSDQSNRINNIMSWWIGLTRPDVMGKAYKAFRQDVMDNIMDVEKTMPDHSRLNQRAGSTTQVEQ